MHTCGSLQRRTPAQCSVDGFTLLFYFILFLPRIHSLWLLILLANDFRPHFFDPPVHRPSDLECAVFFPAVTLAVLHKDGLSSMALLSPIQPPEPPLAGRGLTGGAHVLLSDEVSYTPGDPPLSPKTSRSAHKQGHRSVPLSEHGDTEDAARWTKSHSWTHFLFPACKTRKDNKKGLKSNGGSSGRGERPSPGLRTRGRLWIQIL